MTIFGHKRFFTSIFNFQRYWPKCSLYLECNTMQFLAFTTRSSINGNGWAWGVIILFNSLKSKHNLDLLFSSFLLAKVTDAANGLYDSSIRFFSNNFVICCSIFNCAPIWAFVTIIVSIIKSMWTSYLFTVGRKILSFLRFIFYPDIRQRSVRIDVGINTWIKVSMLASKWRGQKWDE